MLEFNHSFGNDRLECENIALLNKIINKKKNY